MDWKGRAWTSNAVKWAEIDWNPHGSETCSTHIERLECYGMLAKDVLKKLDCICRGLF